MDLGGSADDANRHRHFQFAGEIALRILAPGAQAGIAAIPGGIGVRPGFDGAPVVAGGNHNRIHAIHDALVVRGSPVGIRSGKRPGFDNPIPHLFRR